jgi:P27 family predicted phage terminase small subunit
VQKKRKETTKAEAVPKLIDPKPVPIIECPKELGLVARQEWDRLVPVLTEMGAINELSGAPIAIYCEAYALWIEAVEAMEKYGPMMKSPNGFPIQSPYLGVANKQAEIMLRIATEYGFIPSQSRIRWPSKNDDTLLDLKLNTAW